jgi:hypothetical protein
VRRLLRRLLGCTCATRPAKSVSTWRISAGALPNAYALIDAILTGDVPAANHALQHTTAAHVAAAAIALAQSPRSSDLRASLQFLALQSEIDEIPTGEAG